MGKRKKAHNKKVTARNAKLLSKHESSLYPDLTQALGIFLKDGKHLEPWEHLVQNLNIPSSNADISVYGTVNRTKDGKTLNGSYVKTKEGKYKIFLNPTGFSSFIYRGENKEHADFKPSMQRALHEGETDKIQMAKNFIAALQKSPIYTFFKQPVKWGDENLSFDIDAQAIAQHYGFVSNYLDMTRDEDTAKFFAYTYFDEKTGSYKLIEDFALYSPTLYKANIIDIYKKYGCEPIGFQPFLRPIKQWALAVNLGENYKDIKNLFETHKLTDTKEAETIYEKFKCGKSLFPKELMTEFIDKSGPGFLDTIEWDADYVEFLLKWLIDNIAWRQTGVPLHTFA
jgi:hypothetical protein